MQQPNSRVARRDRIGEYGVAQAHLITMISVDRVVEETGTTIGPTALAQTREVLGDLPGIIA